MNISEHGDFKVVRFNQFLIIILNGNFNQEGMMKLLLNLKNERDALKSTPFIQILMTMDLSLATEKAIETMFSKGADENNFDPDFSILISESIIVKEIITRYMNRPDHHNYPYYFSKDIESAIKLLKRNALVKKEDISALKEKLIELNISFSG